MVVSAIKHRWLHVANQVLEEGTDDHVDDLADLEIDGTGQGRAHVERLELLAASDILLSRLLEELVQCGEGEFVLVDGRSEVERHIVH